LFKSINLLEEIEVALIATFEGLVGLFAAKNVDGALEGGE